ncbi:isoamylase early set domain-containing protein [Gemmatimonas sp. UBA7669]|uniref:isoamylase early set domain-containing protein n=1 Tax=Gemmatimonas sp. UBA7669 TaxID=1946568 RepID=UPI0025C3DA97|nr:isoamylase early set domain-containing protein [Gemmatimonas sp. UBA7669]
MADQPLPFPGPDDQSGVDAELETRLTQRLRASYAALPASTPHMAADCARAVLAEAGRKHGGGGGKPGTRRLPRPQWWWGAAAAAVLVVSVVRPWRPEASQRQADSAFVAGSAHTLEGSTRAVGDGTVRFELRLPATAREVSLVGDFNGWDEQATPMVQQAADGTWSARVPLEPGRHTYAFVVDGQQWLVDPLAPQVPDAGFGPTNAVIVDEAAR